MSDSRVKKSAQNMIAGFSYQALTLILSFISRTVFINTLGKEFLGLNGIFGDVLTLLSMADLGFSTAMAYSFYKPLADKDEDKIVSLINFYRKVYNIIAITVLVLGLLCVPFLDFIVNTEKNIPNLEIYYLFSLSGVVMSYLFVYKTTLLTADQKNYLIVKINMWINTIKTVLQIVSLFLFKDYIVYLAIGVIFQFLCNYISSRKTEKEYPYIKKNKGREVDKKTQKEIFGNMKSVFIYKISGTIFSATDNIIISIVVGTAMVGLYSNYLMLSNKLLLIEQIVFSALTASIGNVIAKESAGKKLEIFKAMQSASFIFCGIISCGFCLVVNDMIYVWLGEEFVLSSVTVIAVTLNTYLACVLQPLWIYRDATGIYMKTKYVMLCAALLNIFLSIILGKIMGVAGVIFASAIARLLTYFWYEPKLLFKEYFEADSKGYFADIIKNILLVIITITVLYFVSLNFNIQNWFTLIIKTLVVGGICCAVFMFSYAKSEGFQIILAKIRHILKFRKGEA